MSVLNCALVYVHLILTNQVRHEKEDVLVRFVTLLNSWTPWLAIERSAIRVSIGLPQRRLLNHVLYHSVESLWRVFAAESLTARPDFGGCVEKLFLSLSCITGLRVEADGRCSTVSDSLDCRALRLSVVVSGCDPYRKQAAVQQQKWIIFGVKSYRPDYNRSRKGEKSRRQQDS